MTSLVAEAIGNRGLRVASLNIDGWLNLPSVRFQPQRPAETSYDRAILRGWGIGGLMNRNYSENVRRLVSSGRGDWVALESFVCRS